MRLNWRPLGFVMYSLLAGNACADQLELSNGDRISGTLVEQRAGKILFDTDYAGQLKINSEAVISIRTDQALRIRLLDGRQLDGILVSDEQGNLLVQSQGESPTLIADFDSIVSIAALPAAGPPPWDWRGNITFGAETKTGNTETDKLNLDSRVVIEQTELNRFTVVARLAREESKNTLTKEQYQLSGKYDRFFMPRWYGFVGMGFEQDKFKDLDLRSTVGAGSGYQFFDSDELRVSLEGGLSYTDEDLISEDDNSYAGFNWGFVWEQALFDKRLNFFHRHRGNQGFDESDNLIVNASTGLRVPVMAGMSATAQYDIDWDRSPPDEADNTDQTYLLGVGYDW